MSEMHKCETGNYGRFCTTDLNGKCYCDFRPKQLKVKAIFTCQNKSIFIRKRGKT